MPKFLPWFIQSFLPLNRHVIDINILIKALDRQTQEVTWDRWPTRLMYLVVQCLAVDLFIWFHQLLVEGSLMTITVVTNLVIEDSQFRLPFSTIARSISWSYSFGFLGVSLVPDFFLTPKCPPQSIHLFYYSFFLNPAPNPLNMISHVLLCLPTSLFQFTNEIPSVSSYQGYPCISSFSLLLCQTISGPIDCS